MFQSPLFSLALIAVIALAIILTSVRKTPGIGILVALVLICATLVLRKQGIAALGFGAPQSWPASILGGVGAGIFLAFFCLMVIDPLTERYTHTIHDESAVQSAGKSLKQLLIWIAVGWFLAALLEETLFRGFFLTEFRNLLGETPLALAATVVVGSVLFGLAHWYQGRSGVWSTGIVGVFFAVLFILGGFNLWMPIIAHGMVDTIGLTLIYLKQDQKLRYAIFKKPVAG